MPGNLTHAVLRRTFDIYFVIMFSSISSMQNAEIYLCVITILNAISKVWQAYVFFLILRHAQNINILEN